MRTTIPLNYKNYYKLLFVYEEDCSCDLRYIGETNHNVEVRRNEHNNPTEFPELSKYLPNNINYCFT